MKRAHKGKEKQGGLTLLVMVIVIFLAISSYYFSTFSIVQIQTDNIQQTRVALKQAKQALLAYAMNYHDTDAGQANPLQGPGNFPCPDDTLDGKSNYVTGVVVPGCNSLGSGTMGRYPWATVQTQRLTDADDELLWYAVSSNFVNFANKKINSGTTGGITVRKSDGTIQYDGTTNDAVVAVIFSPGKILTRNDGFVQSRSTSFEKNDPRNYLDIAFGEDNASFTNFTIDGFIAGTVRNAANNVIVNDVMVVITYEEIMNLVHARVGNTVSKLLNYYVAACDAYPEASAFDPTKTLFESRSLEAMPPSQELREGHLPLNTLNRAHPVDWGNACTVGSVVTTTPVPPAWLVAEGWVETTYYAFAYKNAPHPDAPVASGLLCGSPPNPPCMTVSNTSPLVDNAQALIMFSGRDITVGNRPSSIMSDYFEGENNDLDYMYDNNEIEDYIWVVTPE